MRIIDTFFTAFATFFTSLKSIEIQGHRGLKGDHPENTLGAFASAIEAGADVLEMDLLMTSDDVIIIHHQFHLNPQLYTFRDGSRVIYTPLVRHVPLNEIKQLQFIEEGSSIPTLGEVFDFIRSYDHPQARRVRLNLEIKIDPVFSHFTVEPEKFAHLLIEQVCKSGLEKRIYFSSFDLKTLKEIKKRSPEAIAAFLISLKSLRMAWNVECESWVPFAIDAAGAAGAEILSPEHLLLDEFSFDSLRNAGFQVVPWTVNDPARAEELITMGADGIITDYPHYFIPQRSFWSRCGIVG